MDRSTQGPWGLVGEAPRAMEGWVGQQGMLRAPRRGLCELAHSHSSNPSDLRTGSQTRKPWDPAEGQSALASSLSG